MSLQPDQLIEVFISSGCGEVPEKQKYNYVREGLKQLINSTGFANAYTFESEGASTISAGQHYSFALEDCDVCLFLIDNQDGVYPGVQEEIDLAKKHAKKSLFYFCDQRSKEETPLQKSLMGSKYAKSKTIHDLKDIIGDGAKDLINDLINIYKQYCKGRLIAQDNPLTEHSTGFGLENISLFSDSIPSKDILANIDRCVEFFSKLILDFTYEKTDKTGNLDKLMIAFLPALFMGANDFESSLDSLLVEIKKHQSPNQFVVTEKRYEAIRKFFSGEQESCVNHLKEAFQVAKQNSMPEWFINDILIDLRNQDFYLQESRNSFAYNQDFQQNLDGSQSMLFYPLVDRLDSNYYEGIVKDAFDNKINSPETVHFGTELDRYLRFLANIYVIALYNGSLTHLQMLYQRVKFISFYCATKYSDWNLKKMLLKTTIITGNQNEIDGVIRCFDDLLSKMNGIDAYDIFSFSRNVRITHRQIISKLKTFGVVAYYLDDENFNLIWSDLFEIISKWIEDEDSIISIGQAIFSAIERSYLRISQDQIIDIICNCVHHNKRRFYNDAFRLIWRCVDLNEAAKENVESLIDVVIKIVKDPDERNQIYSLEKTLINLRKKDRELTEQLDEVISEEMPDFYSTVYRLETTKDKEKDMPIFLSSYIAQIQRSNEVQGTDGTFYEESVPPHNTVKNIISQNEIEFSDDLINSAFQFSCQTLLKENERIETKINAIELLVYLLKSRPAIEHHNREIIQELLTNKPKVEKAKAILTNLGETNLRLSALLLYSCLGEDVSADLLIALANIGDDTLSNRNATAGFLNFLQADNSPLSDEKMGQIILQQAIEWCANSDFGTRWNAVQLLFLLLRDIENKDVVCNQLVKLMDTDNVYIKNRILRNIHLLLNVDNETYKYVIQKASVDTNYVVRKVASEVRTELEFVS
jgi:hypothetical protein